MPIKSNNPSESINFRPAVIEDQEVLTDILQEAKTIKNQKGDDAWGKRSFSPEETAELIAQGGVYIGELGGLAVVSVTLLEEDERIWGDQGLDGKALYVHKLARMGDYPGVGRQAMKFAEVRAKELGRTVLRLDNPTGLDSYYESLGFVEVRSLDLGDYAPTLREKQLLDLQ